MRAALRLLAVNLLVALGLFVLAEAGYRAVKFTGSCVMRACAHEYLQAGSKFRQNRGLGLSRPDAVLGYVPDDGRHVIPAADSRPTTVATIRGGLRSNGSALLAAGPATLAVGDSFTFGDEVSDADTWPACLERRLGARVLNGGVFGYGAAQAVLRAERIARHQPLDRLIWSVLIEHDFERDALVARSGVPRPAVIEERGRMRFTSIAEAERILQRTSESGVAKYAAAFGYFYLTKVAWQRLSPHLLPTGARFDGRWSVEHPDAASLPDRMRFALDRYAALPVREKYLVLQYPQSSLDGLSKAAREEVATLARLASERSVTVIDTLAALQARPDRDSLYRRHHTPEGNRVVCATIASLLIERASPEVVRHSKLGRR